MTIGQKIRFYRDLRGYTQAELGSKVHLQADRIRQYETNVRTPKMDKLKEIADELHVSSAQIPVAYAIKKGTIPIVGVTKVNHVYDVLSTLNIKLTDKHIKELENTADHLNLNLIRMWEKKMD